MPLEVGVYVLTVFPRSDGDLSTFAGRQKLWRLIDELQPEHIYVAQNVVHGGVGID